LIKAEGAAAFAVGGARFADPEALLDHVGGRLAIRDERTVFVTVDAADIARGSPITTASRVC